MHLLSFGKDPFSFYELAINLYCRFIFRFTDKALLQKRSEY